MSGSRCFGKQSALAPRYQFVGEPGCDMCSKTRDRVSLTDGGVFDNLGVAVLEPGRAHDSIFNHPSATSSASTPAPPVRRRILPLLVAGPGGAILQSGPSQNSRCRVPGAPQVRRKRRASRLRSNLPRATGCKLSRRPGDLVRREEVRNYPTDFAPMSAKDLELLAKRGEHLTHIVVGRYLPGLGD
jgi:NTE family protein